MKLFYVILLFSTAIFKPSLFKKINIYESCFVNNNFWKVLDTQLEHTYFFNVKMIYNLMEHSTFVNEFSSTILKYYSSDRTYIVENHILPKMDIEMPIKTINSTPVLTVENVVPQFTLVNNTTRKIKQQNLDTSIIFFYVVLHVQNIFQYIDLYGMPINRNSYLFIILQEDLIESQVSLLLDKTWKESRKLNVVAYGLCSKENDYFYIRDPFYFR